MAQPLSVSEALALAKSSLEQIAVTIVGEVSELSDKPGYKAIYFTLTDAAAALPCLMWRNVQQRTGVELRRGMLVEATGVFSLYAAKGRMNFDVKALRLAGEGELRLKVAQRAKRLEAEGLMDPARKRSLPTCPTRIALVTSPRGKAIHDVLRTLRRRWPLAEVLVAGVPVEGAGAAEHLVRGLEAAQESGAELVLLVRGGGSYEDLMPFNDEGLARAIAASRLPVVTGIGHEPDNSIADMVADVRASTPTAAAERVAPNHEELALSLAHTGTSLTRLLTATLARAEATVTRLRNRPLFADPQGLFRTAELNLESAALRLRQSLPARVRQDARTVATLHARLALLGTRLLEPYRTVVHMGAARLEGLSPLAVLARGYSVTYNQKGHIINTVDAVDLDERIRVRLADGSLECTIDELRRTADAADAADAAAAALTARDEESNHA
ncbi:MAG: exodeoxyribonuclease VII large subunit [Coriobacteriales bacterium]|jgi:exodeoxyribonuclease VII large subunit|nr:exodeoxyribonuclease VII large subunit [Coriobacteriales bacterium]